MPARIIHRIGHFCILLKHAFRLFRRNDPLRLAGATAFFANFALPPILIILIRLFGVFTDRRVLVSRLFEQLGHILDESSILQIRQTLRNIRDVNQAWYITLISFVFFIFVATTLFNVIKNSLNQIWSLGVKDKPGIMFNLKLRAISFVVILLAGLLFFVGLLLDSVQVLIASYLRDASPSFGLVITSILNQLIFVAIVTTWFTVLFRFLTNGRPRWAIALSGGILTGVLFTLGKFILRILLPMSNIGNIYGASGSIVLIMLFVFYSSFIFYFGGCYIKVLSIDREKNISPIKGAFEYELKEIDK
ncbi:ribonuclease [Pedobacter yulinensis]|uniref:Ribonuclease n=1 Tax=Pedobacter yulinensis TaxID=2126353 RepID=A0A2T3HII1_9SPHI|nr:YihY/virulence factor BrkB family protein [Pedobacter yulinensis]PST82191.1 ribonuclease [Pedobacter yulinensis]